MANALAHFLDIVADRIERTEQLDKPADKVGRVLTAVTGHRGVKDLLSGTPFGHPLHPLLVTIPIGSWTAATVLDVLRHREAAQAMVGMGVLAALPTALSGLSDWSDTNGGERRVGLVHGTLNNVALTVYAASWLARRRGHHLLGAGLAVVGFNVVGVSGWLGGHLSYALGVGVDTTAFQQASTEWTDAAAEEDVRRGELAAGEVDGVPVVLTRRADGSIAAYADRCTHRGAPLHEGAIVDGCIQCPWHNSQFDLETGAVVHGPATRPQRGYEVRVEAGRVQLRRSEEPRSLRTEPVGR